MVFSRRIESEQKEKKWKRVIEDWEGTDISILKYRRLHNLTKHQFFYWKRKLEGPSRTLSVVPLQINGHAFRSKHLEHVAASLGIALIHARPYKPQGKIERFSDNLDAVLPGIQG